MKKRVTKTIMTMMLALAMLLTSIPGRDMNQIYAASNGFYVEGTTVYDANGRPFVMRGINVAHAWFTSQTATSIKAISATGANTVRIVVSDGKQYTKTTKSELQNIVKLCKEQKLVCILEVHDATGSGDTSTLNSAVDYWKEMKDVLIGNEKYVILNIANEWYGSWNGSAWADGYKTALPQIRNAGISNLIMVDCAGWGQYPDSIKYYGSSVFQADPNKNTMFSIHMYEYAGGNATTVKNNIDNALAIGAPVVIGEFAAEHTNGDVDEGTIMSYCTEKKVGYLGWSWKGNNSDLSSLDIAYNWDGSSYTSWGNTLIYDTYGIKNTSSICSVYTAGSDNNPGSGSSSDSGDNSDSDPYISLFYGSSSASNWKQAVSVTTQKNGGSFNSASVTPNGYFYVEYSGTKNNVRSFYTSEYCKKTSQIHDTESRSISITGNVWCRRPSCGGTVWNGCRNFSSIYRK